MSGYTHIYLSILVQTPVFIHLSKFSLTSRASIKFFHSSHIYKINFYLFLYMTTDSILENNII